MKFPMYMSGAALCAVVAPHFRKAHFTRKYENMRTRKRKVAYAYALRFITSVRSDSFGFHHVFPEMNIKSRVCLW